MGGEQRRFELSGPQIGGSALAAVTAAVAASYLGVAGTVIGAAVMSVGSTVGTAVYTHYLKRTGDKVRQHTVVAWRGEGEEPVRDDGQGELATAAHATVRDPGTLDADGPTAVMAPVDPSAGPAEEEATVAFAAVAPGDATAPMPAVQADGPGPGAGGLPWAKLGAVAALVFAVSLGSILLYQAFAGTTVHEQIRGVTGPQKTGPAPADERRRSEDPAPLSTEQTATPSATPTPTPSPTSTPAPSATPTPATSASSAPNTPAPTATAQPTQAPTSAPSQPPAEEPDVTEPTAQPEATGGDQAADEAAASPQ
jgi:hypothetical protein